MASGTSIIPGIAAAGVATVEAVVPALLAFNPLFALILTAIKAHYNATGTWPTEQELTAALPADISALQASWAAWRPSGDGTFSK